MAFTSCPAAKISRATSTTIENTSSMAGKSPRSSKFMFRDGEVVFLKLTVEGRKKRNEESNCFRA
jgi:hypothetical protein